MKITEVKVYTKTTNITELSDAEVMVIWMALDELEHRTTYQYAGPAAGRLKAKLTRPSNITNDLLLGTGL